MKRCDYCHSSEFYTTDYTHPYSCWYVCKNCGETFLDMKPEYKEVKSVGWLRYTDFQAKQELEDRQRENQFPITQEEQVEQHFNFECNRNIDGNYKIDWRELC